MEYPRKLDDITEEMNQQVEISPEGQVEQFLNEVSDTINKYQSLGTNVHVGLLTQSAAQLAIFNGVSKKKFVAAANTYFIRMKRIVDNKK